MSQGQDDFLQRHLIKPCALVLQRLDEKLLNELLKDHGLKINDRINLKKNRSYHKCNSKVRKNMKELKRKRKRNVKPLCYTDEESDADDANVNFPVENKTSGPKVLSETVQKTSSTIQRCNSPNSGSKFSEEGINTNRERDSPELKKNIEKGEDKVVEKETQRDLPPPVSSVVDCEIEIVQEFLKSGKKICKELVTAEEVEEDLESREDGEDDRSTVIFEEELHTEDVFREKVVSKKFKEKEITNRKKQRLVKFKRKSMSGRNKSKFRKPKAKPGEGAKGSAQAHGEKPTECGTEEYLREVCGLVKRLHELHKIIFQLQKELPSHGELAIHFASVIKAQQENFNREIRKSQKTIIKCYEKLMTTYSDTGKVAIEISKRTSISVEDVSGIISRCVIVEVCPDTGEKTGNAPCRTVSENYEKALFRKPNRATVGSSTNQQSPSYPCTPEMVYRSSREPSDCPRRDFHPPIPRRAKPQIGPPRLEQFPQHGFYPIPRLVSPLPPFQCGPVRNQPFHITPQCYRVDFPHVNALPRSGGFQQSPPVPCAKFIPPLSVPSYSDIPNPVLESGNPSVIVGNFRTVPPPSQNPKFHTTRRPRSATSTDTDKYSNPSGSFVSPVELAGDSCSAEVQSSANQVLDPTVPQKLTMRNSRLEAGPVLGPPRAGDSDVSVRPNPSTEVDVLSRDSTSREYVCAQNECKNPGVRICRRCHSVIYCSEACQLQHWTMKHKVECYQLMELRG